MGVQHERVDWSRGEPRLNASLRTAESTETQEDREDLRRIDLLALLELSKGGKNEGMQGRGGGV